MDVLLKLYPWSVHNLICEEIPSKLVKVSVVAYLSKDTKTVHNYDLMYISPSAIHVKKRQYSAKIILKMPLRVSYKEVCLRVK